MSDNTEIKPCPFCGELPEIHKHFSGKKEQLMHRCKVIGPVGFEWGCIKRQIERWNTRNEVRELKESKDAL